MVRVSQITGQSIELSHSTVESTQFMIPQGASEHWLNTQMTDHWRPEIYGQQITAKICLANSYINLVLWVSRLYTSSQKVDYKRVHFRLQNVNFRLYQPLANRKVCVSQVLS